MPAWRFRQAGAALLNMEFVQFHPTHMVWPLSVAGLLVTESVRGDGGVLRNSEGKAVHVRLRAGRVRAQYAETEEEADRWYNDQASNRRPPELLPRDEVARSIRAEVKAGRGSPHGGVFLDIASRRPAEEISPLRGWTNCSSAPRTSARRAAAPTTRAGTWPWTCATSTLTPWSSA